MSNPLLMLRNNIRWAVITMIALATVINYIDRSAIGILWPAISDDLGLDKEGYRNIAIFFMVGYAIGQSLFGRIFDMIGTRIGFVLAISAWSLSIALHALASNVLTFGIFRFFLGVSEAGNWPGATKSNAEWFPIKERALAQGIFNAGASIGAILSAPVIAALYIFFDSWQVTFVVIGVFGFVWILPWLLLYKAPPERHPWLSEQEREYILTGQKPPEETEDDSGPLAPGGIEILRRKQSWSVILSRFFLDSIWWMFLTWLPIYLVELFGFDVRGIGLYAWVPYVGAAAGAITGGSLANYLFVKNWSTNKTRKFTIALGGVIMFPTLIATSYAVTPLTAVLLMAVILFGFQVSIGNIQTLPSDFYSGKSVGTLAGYGGTAAIIGVIGVTYFVPWLTEGGNWVPFFVLGALLVPLALASVWIFGGNIQQVKDKSN